MTDFAALLNPEQYAAATSGDGPLLVLAAAGTGKTQTLVYRVAFLVESGVPPEAILLLTFTNRAAREMLERAHHVAGDAVGGVWSGTFHHVCNRLLRRFAPRLDYRHDFVIADRDDARKLIDDCLKDLKLAHKDFPKRDVLAGLFSQAANRCRDVADLAETQLAAMSVDPQDVARVAAAYEARKRALGVMDFDDLLVNALRLVREHEEVRTLYQRQFRHILVDEFQDTNPLQSAFVDLLAAHHGNLMAVGDDFQCIYSWRGADFRNIMDFPKRHPSARIIKLERNYRSVPEVLAVANACIAGNPEQFQKTLRATRAAGVKPRVIYLRDGQEQSQAVSALIRRHLDAGVSPRQIAVLYRAHFHSIELQLDLTRARIPHVITSGVGIFEQAHVKDLLALLRVAESPHDRLAFERLLGLLHGVGPRSIEQCWQQLGGAFDSRDADQRARLRDAVKAAARPVWERIDAVLAAYHETPPEERIALTIGRFMDDFYLAYLERSYDNPDERADDLREMIGQIARSGSVPAFLQEVALLTNMDHAFEKDNRTPGDAIRLSTVHQAKGLEWRVVVILWAAEGMFPLARSLGEDDDDAEERRLFYVAVTRARDELIICVPEWRRMRDGGSFCCLPSRFVSEVPPDLLRASYGLRSTNHT